MKPLGDWHFNDLALYAKGWYERKNLVKDISYIFKTIYGYTPDNKHDLASMMFRVLDKLRDHTEPGERYWWTSLSSLDDHITHNMHMYNVDRDEAVVYTTLSILMEMEASVLCLKKPVYGKKMHFRKGPGIFATYEAVRKSRTETYKHMNEEASRFFDK
jgi:hypothetical protein